MIPPQKLYIMTNLLMLTKEERNTLKKRLEREKAAVVWLYAPGVFYPENGPSAGNISDLLGIGMKMVAKWMAPVMELKDGWGQILFPTRMYPDRGSFRKAVSRT